jgi:hypothetical protein
MAIDVPCVLVYWGSKVEGMLVCAGALIASGTAATVNARRITIDNEFEWNECGAWCMYCATKCSSNKRYCTGYLHRGSRAHQTREGGGFDSAFCHFPSP